MYHYTEWYKMEHRPKPCASCGAQVKAGTKYTRYCPDPHIVNGYITCHHELQEIRTIAERDNICLDCYKLHTEIVKMEKSNKPSSCDSELQGLINGWTAELAHKQMIR